MIDVDANEAFCILPWIHSYFYPDGKVALCCVSAALLRDDRAGKELNIQTHSLEEIFNSPAHESVRKAMLEGRKVEHCAACYHEDRYSRNSHRHFYNDLWLKGRYRELNLLEKIAERGEKSIVASPLSVDYRLGNLCNLKCQICNPQNSSQIEKDAEFSAWNPCDYQRLPHRFNDAEEWYESEQLKGEIIRAGEEIRYIKLAGGEPTINRTLISWLEHLVASGKARNIELSISTNFTNTNRSFYELLESFETVKLHLSIDGYGELNDYLRYPSNWSAIMRNIEHVCRRRDEGAPFIVGITPVVNVYNALQIVELFDWAEGLGLGIIANEVRGVPQIDCNLIPPEARKLACARIRGFLSRSPAHGGNSTIHSLLRKLEEPFDERVARQNISNFYKFTDFIDAERKQTFAEVCPEMASMLHDYYDRIGTEAAMKLDQAKQLLQLGRAHEALEVCRLMVEANPADFDALLLAGRAARQMGQQVISRNLLQAALDLQPTSTEALFELGAVLELLKQPELALDCYRQILQLHPDSVQASFAASTVLYDLGHMDEAMAYCQTVLALQPDYPDAQLRMAMIHFRRHDLHRSLESLYQLQAAAPDDLHALNLIALNKISLGLPDEAVPYLEQVLARQPDDVFALANLQDAQQKMRENATLKEALYNSGLIDEAERLAREDLACDDSVENHNFLLKCYLASARHTAHDLYLEGREWARSHEHEEALPAPASFKNKREPNRRLRIGIVGDYFAGVIGSQTLIPWFKLYDRSRMELFCYNFGPGGEYIRPLVDRYRDISQMTGDSFFKLVRDDVIDIMLDINGRIRTPNHFETLLRQPAPIQVNWYNLPCTVGVQAFNYVISDDYCIRAGEEGDYVEKVFRMPTGTICAWDMGKPPEAAPPACLEKGYVTFGCFADFFKIGEETLAVWARLLARVPGSRLYLKSNNLRVRAERERVIACFAAHGITADRLIMEGLSTLGQMKKCYEWVDIALDTFPYSSGSTTINALWQGIPVVAIDGADWRGRTAAAVLAGAGLDEFVAPDVDGYIDKAVALAASPARLAGLRATLGRHIAASPQWDVKTFAVDFEKTLRSIWQDWLKTTEAEKKGR
jgi:predicted O-linked N-acetylglucosamine transferase (SPINDLY family)/sulfatase maturation enzyme AslB (radical SAM superfamily)